MFGRSMKSEWMGALLSVVNGRRVEQDGIYVVCGHGELALFYCDTERRACVP